MTLISDQIYVMVYTLKDKFLIEHGVMGNSRGYTALQLIMIIVVLGIMAAASVIRFPSYNTIKTEGLWGVFINDLRYTAMLAISENNCYYMTISATSYSIFDSNGTNITPTDESSVNPFTSGAILPAGTIAFNGMGQPFSDTLCNTPLTTTTTYTINSGAPTARTINIYPYTGFIE